MDNTTHSSELKRLAEMNQRKADSLSKKNLLDYIASLPGEGVTADNLDWEIGKKSMSITVGIDRGGAIEKLTWELSAKKNK
ncbi:MAG: hypothetical protein JW699_06340 [Chitinispirillaceae bacterium]|nr:hypothetical protein [Chitinispirillaceae bacterium]